MNFRLVIKFLTLYAKNPYSSAIRTESRFSVIFVTSLFMRNKLASENSVDFDRRHAES
jgi:hypothetical protein